MSSADFNDHLSRLRQPRAAAPARIGHALPPPHSRRERLQNGLILLARAGITGPRAYPGPLHALARRGLILPPLQFWPPTLLLAVFASGGAAIMAAVALLGALTGWLPQSVRMPLAGGPAIPVLLCLGLGGAMSLQYKSQALRADLPRWRDL